MARSRMIKPEFFDDEKLAEVSRDARLLFTGLWVNSDDYAVVKGNHKWLKSKIFPYDEISSHQFAKWMKELEGIDCIRAFKANEENFYWIRTFNNHQTINKPSQTRNPSPPEALMHQCSSTTVILPSETETETETETEVNTLVRNSSHDDNGFDKFWKNYPRKIGKKAAQNAWKKAKGKPSVEKILSALDSQKRSVNWTKDDGQFIPHPATWLNQGRWDDELDMTFKPPITIPPRTVSCPGCGRWVEKCNCQKGLET